jgi:hypothetical protein
VNVITIQGITTDRPSLQGVRGVVLVAGPFDRLRLAVLATPWAPDQASVVIIIIVMEKRAEKE